LIRAVLDAHAVWYKRVPTRARSITFEQALAEIHPRGVGPTQSKYITIKTRPPSFYGCSARAWTLFPTYLRYLINAMRETRSARHTIRLTLRKKIRMPEKIAARRLWRRGHGARRSPSSCHCVTRHAVARRSAVLPKLVENFMGGNTARARRDFQDLRNRLGANAVFSHGDRRVIRRTMPSVVLIRTWS
jgi:hypothetical protein